MQCDHRHRVCGNGCCLGLFRVVSIFPVYYVSIRGPIWAGGACDVGNLFTEDTACHTGLFLFFFYEDTLYNIGIIQYGHTPIEFNILLPFPSYAS